MLTPIRVLQYRSNKLCHSCFVNREVPRPYSWDRRAEWSAGMTSHGNAMCCKFKYYVI
jgi:hypothetical protein